MKSCGKSDNPGLCVSGPNGLDSFSGVVIDIALMSEDMPTIHQDCSTTRYLSPIDVTWNQFHNLFYFNNSSFTPNTTLGCVCPFDKLITHDDKVISDASGRSKDYTLMNELLEHYTEHLEESPLCWDVCSRVEFEKKVSSIKSLFDVGVCNVKCSLSLDEFFSSLNAHGVEINEASGMPTLAAQQKKVVALVTTKFVSQNNGADGDGNVPDLNICWPFRIDFRACISSPMGRGCCTTNLVKNLSPEQYKCGKSICVDPCEKNENACNSLAYGVDDSSCEKLNIDGTPTTLADLLDDAALFSCSGAEEEDLCLLIPKLAATPQRALYPCINNLDMSELCKQCCIGFNLGHICWPYLESDTHTTQEDAFPQGTDADHRTAKVVVNGPDFNYTLNVILHYESGAASNNCCITPKTDGAAAGAVWSIEMPSEGMGAPTFEDLTWEEANRKFCSLIAEGHQASEFDAYVVPFNDVKPLPGSGNEDTKQKRACTTICENYTTVKYWTYTGCHGGWKCRTTAADNPCSTTDSSGCNAGAGAGVIKPKNIASPWGCTDWCPGDRYKTSYETATWKLHCDDGCDPTPLPGPCELESDNTLSCDSKNPNAVGDCCNIVVATQSLNDTVSFLLSSANCDDDDDITAVLVPSEKNNLWRWHQVCCDDTSGGGDCYNIIGCQQFCPPSQNCCKGPCGPKNGGRCGSC